MKLREVPARKWVLRLLASESAEAAQHEMRGT